MPVAVAVGILAIYNSSGCGSSVGERHFKSLLCSQEERVNYCRYCYLMVCYVQVRVRSSSGCMYGVHGVAAVEAAGPSP